MKNLIARSLATVCMLAAVACAGDTVSDESTDAEQELGGGSSSGGSSSNTNGAGTDSSGGSCGPSSVNKDDPCEVCVASNCSMLALACCNKTGCMDIIDCAQETACEGIACYADDTCKDVIDAAGGAGIALNYAEPLGDCAMEKCAAECGG